MMINDEMTKMRGSVHVLLLFIGGCSLNKRTIKCAKMRDAHAQFAMAGRPRVHHTQGTLSRTPHDIVVGPPFTPPD